jgi:hypothetical protein
MRAFAIAIAVARRELRAPLLREPDGAWRVAYDIALPSLR